MTRELLLADKIMKEANYLTGWGFSIKSYEEGYVVETNFTKKEGQVLYIRFEIQKSEVAIYTILPELEFDEEKLKQELDLLDFSVEAMGISGIVLTLESKMSFIDARRNTTLIVGCMMMPMVVAMLKQVENRTAA